MAQIPLDPKFRELFRLIVEYYIKHGLPVGSKTLVNHFRLPISTATVRNQMAFLEEKGLIEKSHASSGRVPSHIGLEFFAQHYEAHPDQDLRLRLDRIFSKRTRSIETTISLAAQAISDLVGVTLVTSQVNEGELLKNIQLVQLDENNAVIVLVTSSGRVFNKTLNFSETEILLEDLRISIRIFNERLYNVPLWLLSQKAAALKPILATSILRYEKVLHTFIIKVFDFQEMHKNQVYGRDKIVLSRDIQREDLISILNFIEDKSIWAALEDQSSEDETIKIEVRPNNISFISKRLLSDGKIKREISAIGSAKMDYVRTKNALLLLEEYIKETEK